jgi:hypothetical protein
MIFYFDMNPLFKEGGVCHCLTKALQNVEECNWPAYLARLFKGPVHLIFRTELVAFSNLA